MAFILPLPGGPGSPGGQGGQPISLMKCLPKVYSLHGLNHQIIEKSSDAMPVTFTRTCERRAVFCLGRIRNIEILLDSVHKDIGHALGSSMLHHNSDQLFKKGLF